MKQFLITEQQLTLIANILLELPAKNVLSVIDLIRNLPAMEEKKEK